MMNNNSMTAASILWIAVAWNAILLFSTKAPFLACALTSPEISEVHLRFGDFDDKEDKFFEPNLAPHYRVQYHYHYGDRHTTDCQQQHKRAKSMKVDTDEDRIEYHEHGCNPTSPSPSASPGENFTEPNTASPTQAPEETFIPTQDASSDFVPPITPTELPTTITRATDSPTKFTTHSEMNVIPQTHPSTMFRYYWILGTAIAITAFLGGFALSTMYSQAKQPNFSDNTDVAIPTSPHRTSGDSNLGSNASVEISVDDSVDSYYIEDWSVSVVSWTPNEGIEVTSRPKRTVPNGNDEDDGSSNGIMEEIEIEFHEDLEGYGSGSSSDDEDPKLFDVVDLSSRNGRQSSF